MAKSSKQEKLFRIALEIFSLEASKGHLRWKVTDLVRKSGVSRPLIYRYLGSSKSEILESAVEVFCAEFYGFSGVDAETDFITGVMDARAKIQKNFEAVLFYQQWRERDSHLKNHFLRVEAKFRAKLQEIRPHLSDEQALTAHACIHGLVTSPFLSPKQAGEICKALAAKKIF